MPPPTRCICGSACSQAGPSVPRCSHADRTRQRHSPDSRGQGATTEHHLQRRHVRLLAAHAVDLLHHSLWEVELLLGGCAVQGAHVVLRARQPLQPLQVLRTSRPCEARSALCGKVRGAQASRHPCTAAGVMEYQKLRPRASKRKSSAQGLTGRLARARWSSVASILRAWGLPQCLQTLRRDLGESRAGFRVPLLQRSLCLTA